MRLRHVSITISLVLVLATSAWAGSETVLYQFMGDQGGYTPLNGVLLVRGKVYGTTSNGGLHNAGTVFELSHTRSGWVKKTIYAFTSLKDGGVPESDLTADDAGNLYGSTCRGGDLRYCYKTGCGVVFELALGPKGWKETVLHRFNLKDGAYPGDLLWDKAGNLYGGTSGGGDPSCQYGCGTVFKLSRSQTGWRLTTIFAFSGKDGDGGGLGYRDSFGNLYGISGRGPFGFGTVFRLSPTGKNWKLTILHSFTGGADGGGPLGRLVADKDGSIYGTGVISVDTGVGVIYRLASSGHTWKETVLHHFAGGASGRYPSSGVVFDSDGSLYGVLYEANGGSDDYGAIYKLTNSGGQWNYGIAFNFDGTDGYSPGGDLTVDAAGNIYGTTSESGNFCNGDQSGCGNVYEFTP
jgi:uncharacterized repeat protein (TIGR03803 family)